MKLVVKEEDKCDSIRIPSDFATILAEIGIISVWSAMGVTMSWECERDTLIVLQGSGRVS